MPNQNNLIRPSSTVYSASSTMKLHDTASEKERKKTSIVILTLLSLIIFLFILCEYRMNRSIVNEEMYVRFEFCRVNVANGFSKFEF